MRPVAAVTIYACLLTGAQLLAAEANLDVRRHYLAGGELRLVVETSRSYLPLLSHSSKTTNAKGWFVTVNLDAPGPPGETARVLGPLWDVPDPRSCISFQTGANFTPEDAHAAAVTPWIVFDPAGELVRIGPAGGADRSMVRDHLDVTAGTWKRDGPYVPIPDPFMWPGSEDQVDTFSHRYHLQRADGKATLYETFTGKAVDDPWLSAAFEHYRAIKDMQNVQAWLTEDLKYLVCSPASVWNDNRRMVETFELEGNTYRRDQWGFYYARSGEKPILFRKEQGEGIALANGPSAAFSIGGELYLYYRRADPLRLVRLTGGGRAIEHKPPPEPAWGWTPPYQVQHDEPAGRIVFFGDDVFAHPHGQPLDVVVFIWDYRRSTITSHTIDMSGLFKRDGAHYRPRRAIPVR
jgi:hypothetical protein